MRTAVEATRHTLVAITRRYAIDTGWSTFGVTPGGGGSNPTLCSELAMIEETAQESDKDTLITGLTSERERIDT
jgi:hypothetical protein